MDLPEDALVSRTEFLKVQDGIARHVVVASHEVARE
jgi:hypothetical protein